MNNQLAGSSAFQNADKSAWSTQLAHHFEQGMQWDKALGCTRVASDVAVKRFSPNEALSILGREPGG